MPPRIACLLIPAFPLAAALRARPELRHQPVAVLDGAGGTARVAASSHTALEGGVARGLSRTQARLILPHLIFCARDPAAEDAARNALIETAEAFSPRVEPAEPGAVFLDLFREKAEPRLCAEIDARARAAGVTVRIGVAGTCVAARAAAARATQGPVIIPPNGDAAALAALAIAALPLPKDARETLRQWGIQTIGAFATIDERDVLRRLGKPAAELHREARGLARRPLIPKPPTAVFSEGVTLEWPVFERAPFLALAQKILERLTARLAAAGVGCRRLDMILSLDPQGHETRRLTLPAPSAEASTLLRLIAATLEARPPTSPVNALRFDAQPEKTRAVQLTLFGPPAVSPDALAATLTRLAALVGEGRVGSPRPGHGPLPGGFTLAPYAPPPVDVPTAPIPAATALAAARILRPAVPLRVTVQGNAPAFLATVGDAPPTAPTAPPALAFRESGPPVQTATARPMPRRREGRTLRIAGPVAIASGPWQMEDGWWTGGGVRRAYWDVELAGGGVYRIYEDAATGRWHADGVYD